MHQRTANVRTARSWSEDQGFNSLTAATLLAALVCGGATGKWAASDAAVLALAGPLLVWSVLRARKAPVDRLAAWGFAAFALAAVVQAAYLIPLPPSVWTGLPGREALVQVYASAGIEPGWMPLSIAPWATAYGLATLVVPASLFAAVLTLSSTAFRMIVFLILAVAVASVLLGGAQMATGPESSLRPFEFTNVWQPVGFFANANHLACFLAICVPLAAQQAMAPSLPPAVRWLCAGAAMLALVGCVTTLSRAGFLLALVACIAAAFIVANGGARKTISTIAILGGVALVVFVQFGLVGLTRRIETAGSASSRLTLASDGLEAAAAFAPVGSGFGTARTAFAMTRPPENLSATVVNQIHNDWVQLWLEGGVPGALVGLAILAWFAVLAFKRLRSSAAAAIVPVAGVVIILMHSLVDYPLRTLAIQAMLGLLLGLLALPAVRGAVQRRASPQPSGARTRTRR
jgi:O-antigen ligase